jgi:hypothetical protein
MEDNMNVEVFVEGSVEKIVDKMRKHLEEKGFLFTENKRSYIIRYPKGKVEKNLSCLNFWARKQLEAPFPTHASIEIEGDVLLEGQNTVIRVEFTENHVNRPHWLWTPVMEEYLNVFSEIFRDQ